MDIQRAAARFNLDLARAYESHPDDTAQREREEQLARIKFERNLRGHLFDGLTDDAAHRVSTIVFNAAWESSPTHRPTLIAESYVSMSQQAMDIAYATRHGWK